jgi:hypothetical protein
MNSTGQVTFAVTPKGTLKLYDSTRDALEKKDVHDVVLTLSLTKHQIADVVRAELLAANKERESSGRRS